MWLRRSDCKPIKLRKGFSQTLTVEIDGLEHVLIKVDGKYVILVFDGILLKDFHIFYTIGQVRAYFEQFNLHIEAEPVKSSTDVEYLGKFDLDNLNSILKEGSWDVYRAGEEFVLVQER